MSDLETEDRKLREDSLSQIEVAKEALHKNPCDTQRLKKGPLALRKLYTPCEVHECLRDAKTKLEKVLETHQHDHKAKFDLGCTYYNILKTRSVKYFGTYGEFYDKAIEYFNDVKDKVPEAGNMLHLVRFLPSKFDEEQEPSIEDASESLSFEQKCNFDNLMREAQRWIGSSFFTWNDDEKKECLKGAIEKFSEALLIKPNDILLKMQLATARVRNCDVDKDGRAEYDRLWQELCELEKERRLMEGPLYMDERGIIRRRPINKKRKEKKKRVPIAEQCSYHKAPTKIDTEASSLFRGMRTRVERLCNPAAMLPHMANGGERFGIPAAAMQLRPMANGGTRYRILVPLTRLLLHKLISRK